MEQGSIKVHIAWFVVLLVGIVLVRVYYVGQMEILSLKHMQENESAVRLSQVTNDNVVQVFDGRSDSNESTSEEIWNEVGEGKAFFEGIFYNFEGNEIKLSSEEIWKDSVSSLLWSAPTNLPIDNKFTLDGERIVGTGAAGFCDLLNNKEYGGLDNWLLPTQKQLMQAYINGAGGIVVERPIYLWSSTEFFGDSDRAWRGNLMAGDVASSPKSNKDSNYAICVSKG